MYSREEMENIKTYEKLIAAIRQYCAGRNIKYMFLHGGCYWLASIIHGYVPGSEIVFNRKMQHCACLFNNGIYDIRGRITKEGFKIAVSEDIKYMKKRFIPCFDADALGRHLHSVMEDDKGKDKESCGKM